VRARQVQSGFARQAAQPNGRSLGTETTFSKIQQTQQRHQMGRRNSAPAVHTTEQVCFVSFVELLSSRPPEEAQKLLYLAMQEATRCRGARPASAGTAGNGGLRKAASADDLRVGRAASASKLVQRRRQIAHAWDQPVGAARPSEEERTYRHMEEERAHKQMEEERCKLFARYVYAATTLQSHWRGWQHRRFARFLRARSRRHRRLDWLWRLRENTGLLKHRKAALLVQAAWRARRSEPGPDQDAARAAPAPSPLPRPPPRAGVRVKWAQHVEVREFMTAASCRMVPG
jgi:hypothetical protein